MQKDALFTVKEAPGNRLVKKYLRELPQRMEAAGTMLSHAAAAMVVAEIRKTAPDIAGFDDYRESVVLRQVLGEVSEFAVVVEANAAGTLNEDDAPTTVLSFAFLNASADVHSEEARMLVMAGPWPADMVPFRAPRGELKVSSKRLTVVEVNALRNRLRESWKDLKREAAKRGLEMPKKPESYVGQKVNKNIAFQVLRSEFGVGEPLQPHWRPAVRKVKKAFPKLWETIRRTVADPSYSGWRARLAEEAMSSQNLRDVVDFQDRL